MQNSLNIHATLRVAALGGALLAGGLSDAVHAQSSVSLYGEIDAGLAWASKVDAHPQYRFTSGLVDGSYVGLQGSEDLGGGTKAIFRLERGFSVAGGEALNDHPYLVGLESASLGAVSFGRQYDPLHDYFAPFTLTGGTGGTAFAHPFDNDNANNSYLAANAIRYASPDFGGFTFGGMYAFSGSAGNFAGNRAYGIGAAYSAGAFNAGAAWLHNNGRGVSAPGAGGAYEPFALPASGGQVVDVMARRQDTLGVGASYALGDVTLSAAWSRLILTGVEDADSGAPLPSLALSNYEVNALWQATPAISLAGMYVYTKGAGGHWHEAGVQGVYQISKRTDIYGETLFQRASEGMPAMINGFDPAGGRNQLVVGAGLRHRF